MDDAARAARRMWTLFEPVHVVTYFSAEARSAFDGRRAARILARLLRRPGRAAGPRSAPHRSTASFFSFAPPMVGRALPAVWELITPGGRAGGAVGRARWRP